MFPDYGPEVERIGDWIAAGANLAPGRTLLLEPELPEAPDVVAACFEAGGQWDRDRGIQDWGVLLVARAPTLAQSRALARECIVAALQGFATANEEQRGLIQMLDLASLPIHRGRDERGRVILEATLRMRIFARDETGVAL